MEQEAERAPFGGVGESNDGERRILHEKELRALSVSIPTLFAEDRSRAIGAYHNILFTAKQPGLPSAYGALLVNALCACVDCPEGISNSLINADGLEEPVEISLFNLFLTKIDSLKSKSSRRLLLTATKLISQRSELEERDSLVFPIFSKCVDTIQSLTNDVSVKAAFQLLDQFLHKSLISALDILCEVDKGIAISELEHNETLREANAETVRNAVSKFVNHVFTWAQYPDCSTVISRFSPHFFDSLHSFVSERDSNAYSTSNFWIQPVKTVLQSNQELLQTFEHHILPGLLGMKSANLQYLRTMIPFDDVLEGKGGLCEEIDLQMCLLTAKISDSSTLRLLVADNILDGHPLPNLRISDRVGMMLLDHASADIRVAALSLLASSPSNSPLTVDVLVHLRQCLPYFHRETNAKTRNEFVALSKLLSTRLKATFRHLKNQKKIDFESIIPVETESMLRSYSSFFKWYQDFLISELLTGASYQAHITALQRLLRPLLDLILNPFDDVRQAAASILDSIFEDAQITKSEQLSASSMLAVLEDARKRADRLMRRTCRADHSDGFGRIQFLIYRLITNAANLDRSEATEFLKKLLHTLEKEVEELQKNMLSAISASSLHGHIIALRYVFGRIDLARNAQKGPDLMSFDSFEFATRLLHACARIWGTIRDVLCFDAPEGHVVDDDNGDHAEQGSEDALSFCWRALKESSLLERTIVEKWSMIAKTNGKAISVELLRDFGNVIFSQLAELRHRGAFSAVAQTFTAWCVICSKSTDNKVMELPLTWYQDVLSCIHQRSNAVTRRSAGLPAMVIAILASVSNSSKLHEIVLDLQAIADVPAARFEDNDTPRLPQVHALNCLKDIFTDSRFAGEMRRHIPTTLSISVSCLESDIWAIKNCGLMLLNALLRRVNGGGDPSSLRVSSSRRQGSPLVYKRYPVLADLVLKLLMQISPEKQLGASDTQTIFAALEIIERFGLPRSSREEALDALRIHIASRFWSIREKAAKAMSFTVDLTVLIQEADHLINHHWSSQNELHGRLLCTRFILKRMDSKNLQLGSDILLQLESVLENAMERASQSDVCEVNRSAFRGILTYFVENFARESHLVQLWDSRLSHSNCTTANFIGPVAIEYEESLNRCFVDPDGAEEEFEPNHCQNPAEYEQRLQLIGFQLAKTFAHTTDRSRIRTETAVWTRCILLALQEQSELPNRLAAAASMAKFFQMLHQPQMRPTAAPEVFELFPMLYNLLVDDDEDVRECGAKAVSSFISKFEAKETGKSISLSLSAPAARSRLLKYLVDSYPTSTSLLIESIWKMTGTVKYLDVRQRVAMMGTYDPQHKTPIGGLQLKSVSSLLAAALREQNVIFEEEKQNLYIDCVSETKSWTDVALAVDQVTWSAEVVAELRGWTVEGLLCLTEALTIREDGPLGFTSKEDVFILFIKVVLTARLLLRQSMDETKRDTSTGKKDLEKALAGLIRVGQKAHLHPSIVAEIEEAFS